MPRMIPDSSEFRDRAVVVAGETPSRRLPRAPRGEEGRERGNHYFYERELRVRAAYRVAIFRGRNFVGAEIERLAIRT